MEEQLVPGPVWEVDLVSDEPHMQPYSVQTRDVQDFKNVSNCFIHVEEVFNYVGKE